MAEYPFDVHTTPRLTVTELSVLRLVSEGYSSKAVAERLECSKRTVDFHLGNIYAKYDVNNRVQAINKARELNAFA